jgi:hypothetical protein
MDAHQRHHHHHGLLSQGIHPCPPSSRRDRCWCDHALVGAVSAGRRRRCGCRIMRKRQLRMMMMMRSDDGGRGGHNNTSNNNKAIPKQRPLPQERRHLGCIMPTSYYVQCVTSENIPALSFTSPCRHRRRPKLLVPPAVCPSTTTATTWVALLGQGR